MTKLIEYLCIAYITGSCFTALAIWLGLRSIAGAIVRRSCFKVPGKIVVERSRDGDEFTIKNQ